MNEKQFPNKATSYNYDTSYATSYNKAVLNTTLTDEMKDAYTGMDGIWDELTYKSLLQDPIGATYKMLYMNIPKLTAFINDLKSTYPHKEYEDSFEKSDPSLIYVPKLTSDNIKRVQTIGFPNFDLKVKVEI